MESLTITKTLPLPASSPVLGMPDNLLLEIMEHLPLKDRRRFLASSGLLWRQRRAIEACVHHITVTHTDKRVIPTDIATNLAKDDGLDHPMTPFLSQKAFWLNPSSLVTLDVQGFCTDAFLRFLATLQLLPSLHRISMRRSMRVTDEGLKLMSAMTNLQYVDITYCHNTTYEGTALMREKLTGLQCIRRQPEWLDGHFYTPFGGNDIDASGVEVHTYWPDGTFSFTRSDQSQGFIVELEEWCRPYYSQTVDDQTAVNSQQQNCNEHVRSKLQYNNFDPPWHWPQLTRFCYRPGVSLWRLHSSNSSSSNNEDDSNIGSSSSSDNGNNEQAVLVAQTVAGLRPPNRKELMELAADLVPVGQTRYFDNSNQMLEDEHSQLKHIMVSKIRLEPLQELLAPSDLVRRNMEFCQRRNAFAKRAEIEESEDFLHGILLAL